MTSLAVWAAISLKIQQETPSKMKAVLTEMKRAIAELKLGDQPRPHGIWTHLYTGNQSISYSSFGTLTNAMDKSSQWSRVDVRVGSPQLDNGNFNSYANNNGVVMDSLPLEGDTLAIQRSLWLSIDKAYKEAAVVYNEKKAALKGQPKPELPDMLEANIQWYGSLNQRPTAIESVDRLTRLLSQPEKKNHGLEELTAVVSDTRLIVTMLSTEGHQIQYPSTRFIMRTEAVARAEDGASIRNNRSWVYNRRDQLPSEREIKKDIEEMQRWVVSLKEAPVEQDYLGPVLFEPLAAVELYRQLLPPELSANPPLMTPKSDFEDYSQPVPSSRVGRRILPKGWNVVDDVNLYPEGSGYYRFDSEGQQPQRVGLIQNGVVKNLLMSRIPRKGFTKSSGHGRFAMSERPVPLPAVVQVTPPTRLKMTALRTKGLEMSHEAGNEYLIVIKRITPLALNKDFEVVFSGDGPLSGLTEPLEAFRLYQDGREEPIRGLRFHGADRRILRDAIAAGPQSSWVNLTDAAPGHGRDSVGDVYGLGTSWSAPATLIAEMELKGKSGGEKRLLPKPTP